MWKKKFQVLRHGSRPQISSPKDVGCGPGPSTIGNESVITLLVSQAAEGASETQKGTKAIMGVSNSPLRLCDDIMLDASQKVLMMTFEASDDLSLLVFPLVKVLLFS